MSGPERRWCDDRVAFSHRQQVFVTGNEVVGARCLDCGEQGAQDGLIIEVTQVRFQTWQRFDDFGLYGERIDQIVDLDRCQAMAVCQAGQHASQLVEDVAGKQYVDRTVTPCRQDLARHTCRVSNARKQHIGIEHHPQRCHGGSALVRG